MTQGSRRFTFFFDPSRLFLYYNARKKGDLHDNGAYIRDTIKSIHCDGVRKERTWPYNTKKFAEKPPGKAYDEAKDNIVSKYERLHQDIDQFQACLMNNCPFVFGFNVASSFHKTNNPLAQMPMPKPDEKIVGSHAVLAVGYDDRNRHFTILNSWGQDWGDNGYFYMPYDFIKESNWCYNFWKIPFVEEEHAFQFAECISVSSRPSGRGDMLQDDLEIDSKDDTYYGY